MSRRDHLARGQQRAAYKTRAPVYTMTSRTYVKQYELYLDGLNNATAVLHPMTDRETNESFYRGLPMGLVGVLFSRSGYVARSGFETGANDRAICFVMLLEMRCVSHNAGEATEDVLRRMREKEDGPVGGQVYVQWGRTVSFGWLGNNGAPTILTIRPELCPLLNAAGPGEPPDWIHSPRGTPPLDLHFGSRHRELRTLLTHLSHPCEARVV